MGLLGSWPRCGKLHDRWNSWHLLTWVLRSGRDVIPIIAGFSFVEELIPWATVGADRASTGGHEELALEVLDGALADVAVNPRTRGLRHRSNKIDWSKNVVTVLIIQAGPFLLLRDVREFVIG